MSDLSKGGCRISTEANVSAGTMLEMRLQLPDQKPSLEIGLATVRWVKGAEFGVEFLQVRKDVEERLRQFITELEEKQSG